MDEPNGPGCFDSQQYIEFNGALNRALIGKNKEMHARSNLYPTPPQSGVIVKPLPIQLDREISNVALPQPPTTTVVTAIWRG